MSRRWMALLFMALLVLVTIRLLTTLAEPGSDDGGFADFRDTIHAPAKALLDGVDPYNTGEYRAYDPEIGQAFPLYSPHLLVMTIPLGVLPRPAAGVIWWVLNLAALLLLAGFVVKQVKPEWSTAGLYGLASLTLLSNPGRFNFLTGQITLPIVLGVYLAFTSPSRWAAAAGTTLALIKPQIGIPVLVMLVASGRWKTARDGAGLAALLTGPVVVALTFIENGFGNLVTAITDNLDNSLSGDEGTSAFRIDLAGVLARETDVRFDALATMLVFLGLALLGAVLVRRWGRVDAISMSVVGLVTVLSLFHLPYDELLLLWPIVGLVVAGHRLGQWRWWAVAGMTAAAFNPLTVRFLRVGRGLDTVTGLLLVVALAAVAIGIFRANAPGSAGLEHRLSHSENATLV